MKRNLLSIFTFLFVIFAYWLAGFDFERSPFMALTIVWAVFCAMLCYTCPFIKD